MGSYLNSGSERFRTSLRSQIYVDKSMLIAEINKLVRTEQKYVCVSRPRRFGKSMAADMLLAYYSAGEDTAALFNNLKISKAESYREHLNQYDVIKINMLSFLGLSSVDAILEQLKECVSSELRTKYNDFTCKDTDSFIHVMMDIYAQTKLPFIIIIDDWDCILHKYAHDTEAQKKYLDFLRMWLKDQNYVALAFMTGVLPIKKFVSQAGLNMFSEYTMTNPRELAPYFGFTEEEVMELCAQHNMSFADIKSWYNGYEFVAVKPHASKIIYSIHNPKSIVDAMISHVYDLYWNHTESQEELKDYIQLNIDGLKDAVIKLLDGNRIEIETGTFANDMTKFSCKDDVLTLLVHLGYLAYRFEDKTVKIPNKEVAMEFINTISTIY